MARHGPAPKPTQLQILRGDPGKRAKRRLREGTEPLPTPGVPNPPTWLDREARAEWRRLIKTIPPAVITLADRAVLAMCCEAWSSYAALVKQRMVKTSELVSARASWLRLSREIGVTPSSRVGITVDGGWQSVVDDSEDLGMKEA